MRKFLDAFNDNEPPMLGGATSDQGRARFFGVVACVIYVIAIIVFLTAAL